MHGDKKVTVKGFVYRAEIAPRSSPAIGAPMSLATSSATGSAICLCWRRSGALWTRRRVSAHNLAAVDNTGAHDPDRRPPEADENPKLAVRRRSGRVRVDVLPA